MKITPKLLRQWNSCYTNMYHEIVFLRHNCTEASLLEIASWTEIPAKDRIWVLLRREILSVIEIRWLALSFAEHVLHIWTKRYPKDKTVAALLDITKQYLLGKVAKEELLRAKQDVAAAAATYAACAACAAADAAAAVAAVAVAVAAVAAAAYAAYAAYADAAYAADVEREWQLKQIVNVLKKKEKKK